MSPIEQMLLTIVFMIAAWWLGRDNGLQRGREEMSRVFYLAIEQLGLAMTVEGNRFVIREQGKEKAAVELKEE